MKSFGALALLLAGAVQVYAAPVDGKAAKAQRSMAESDRLASASLAHYKEKKAAKRSGTDEDLLVTAWVAADGADKSDVTKRSGTDEDLLVTAWVAAYDADKSDVKKRAEAEAKLSKKSLDVASAVSKRFNPTELSKRTDEEGDLFAWVIAIYDYEDDEAAATKTKRTIDEMSRGLEGKNMIKRTDEEGDLVAWVIAIYDYEDDEAAKSKTKRSDEEGDLVAWVIAIYDYEETK